MLRALWSVPSEPGQEITVAKEVLRHIQANFHLESRLDDIRTALTEACLNAMEHGNGFDPDKFVHVILKSEYDRIRIKIRDDGPGWTDALYSAPNPNERWQRDNPRGWGIVFMRNFSDHVITGKDEQGFFVELHFFLCGHH